MRAGVPSLSSPPIAAASRWGLSSIVPIKTLKAIAQERGPLEKTKLNVGVLAITCATPLIHGVLKEDVDYKKLTEQVMLATDTARSNSDTGRQLLLYRVRDRREV